MIFQTKNMAKVTGGKIPEVEDDKEDEDTTKKMKIIVQNSLLN